MAAWYCNFQSSYTCWNKGATSLRILLHVFSRLFHDSVLKHRGTRDSALLVIWLAGILIRQSDPIETRSRSDTLNSVTKTNGSVLLHKTVLTWQWKIWARKRRQARLEGLVLKHTHSVSPQQKMTYLVLITKMHRSVKFSWRSMSNKCYLNRCQ